MTEDRTKPPPGMMIFVQGWAHFCCMEETKSDEKAISAAWDFVDRIRAPLEKRIRDLESANLNELVEMLKDPE